MCNTIVTSVFDEDTDIESNTDDLNNNLNNLRIDKIKRDIYKKKDQPFRKQFCPFDECNAYFYVSWHLERHLRKHNGEVIK